MIRILFNYWVDVSFSLPLISSKSLFLSFTAYIGYLYLRSLSWFLIINSIASKLSLRDGLRIWFLGESTRFLPLKAWPFASRVYLAYKKNVPKSKTLVSLSLEVGLLLVVTFLISIPSIKFSSQQIIFSSNHLIVLSLILLLVIISALFLKRKIVYFTSQLYKFPKKIINWKFLLAIVFQIVAWLMFGSGTYFLIANFSHADPWVLISAVIFAWLIGYLSFITPTGLGAREGALIVLLSPFLTIGQSTLVAFTSRLLLIFLEVVNLTFWLGITQRKKIKAIFLRVVSNWDLVSLFLLIAIYIVTFSTLSILRHNAFASNFDLANMDQTIWNTLNGRFFTMTSGLENVSRLATHADFILILLSPLYLLWDNVRILLITQSAMLGLGAVPTFLLAKKILKSKPISLIIAVLYLLNPAMQWANIYDFHGVTLSIPLILFAFYFAYLKQWKWYWLFFLLAIITKEEISLVLSSMGFLQAFWFKFWKVGLSSFLIGIVWFVVMIFVIMPHFSQTGQHWALNDWYSPSKEALDRGDVSELIRQSRTVLVAVESVDYYQLLVRPFGFLPLLGLPWLLIALPELLSNLLSKNFIMLSINLHYTSGIIPALVIATIFSLKYLQWIIEKLCPQKLTKYKNLGLVIFCLGVLVYALKFNYNYSPLPTTPSCWCLIYQVKEEDQNFEKILQAIPKELSISASGEVRPHITHREKVFNLPDIPPGTDYIAIIDQERSVGSYELRPSEIQLIKQLLKGVDYKLEYQTGHFYLFKKKV